MKKILYIFAGFMFLAANANAQGGALTTNSAGAITRNMTVGDGKSLTIANGAHLVVESGAILEGLSGGGGSGNGTVTNITTNTGLTISGNGTSTITISGQINVGNINASGTRNSTTVLFGDGHWAAPAGGGGGNVSFNSDGNFTGNIGINSTLLFQNPAIADGTNGTSFTAWQISGNEYMNGTNTNVNFYNYISMPLSGNATIVPTFTLIERVGNGFALGHTILQANTLGLTIGEGQGTQTLYMPGGNITSTFSNGSAVLNFGNITLTGIPTAPTAANGTNTTQLASTAFVQAALAAFTGGNPWTSANWSVPIFNGTGATTTATGANGTVLVRLANGTITLSSTINGNLTFTGNTTFNGNVSAPNIVPIASDGSGHYYLGGSGPAVLDGGFSPLFSVNGGFAITNNVSSTLIVGKTNEGATGTPVLTVQRAGGANWGPTDISFASSPDDTWGVPDASYGTIYMGAGGTFELGSVVVTGSPPWLRSAPSTTPTSGIGAVGLDQEWRDTGAEIPGAGVTPGGYYFRSIWQTKRDFSTFVADPYFQSDQVEANKTIELRPVPNNGYAQLFIRGTTSYRLSSGSTRASAGLVIQDDARDGDQFTINVVSSNASVGGMYRNNATNMVAEGSSSAGLSIYTNHSGATLTLGAGAGTLVFTLSPGAANLTGNLNYTGALNSVSDERLKYDVQSLGDDWTALYDLRPVSFRWNAAMKWRDPNYSKNVQLGFIAQEVQRVAPELVNPGIDGYLGVDYGKITPLLVAALQAEHKENMQERWVNVTAFVWLFLLSWRLHHRTKHHRTKRWH